MNIKRILISTATIATTLLATVSPAFAVPNPKATGGIMFEAYSLQRYVNFDAQQTSNVCSMPWDVTGAYTVAFNLTNDPTLYVHDMNLSQSGSNVTGTGGYPAGGPYSYSWHVTSGTVTGNTLSLTVLYDTGATGTVMNMTGTIAPNGTMSGTWSDDFGGSRTGDWSTKTGSAHKTLVGCTGKGIYNYADANMDWYQAKITCVSVSGNTAVFSGPVKYASNPSWLSNYVIVKVEDNATPGWKGDKISASFVSTGDPHCDTSGLVNGPFDVSGGNLVVH